MYRARYLRDPGPLPQRVRELRNVLELRNVSLELRNVSVEGNSKISERSRPALPPSEFDTRFNVYSWGGKVYTRLSAQVQTASPRKCRHLGPNCRPTELTKGSGADDDAVLRRTVVAVYLPACRSTCRCRMSSAWVRSYWRYAPHRPCRVHFRLMVLPPYIR
jgi:hypothetical protein